MTHEQAQSLKDDIAYMRALAEEGRKTPLLGGAILVTAGLVFGLASVAHWAVVADVLDVGMEVLAGIWLAAMVVFIGALVVLNAKLARKPGARSPANRAAGAAWGAVGGAVFVLAVSMGFVAWRTQSDVAAYLFPSVILALYGTGWAVSATMSERRWMRTVAIGSWIGAPAVAWLTGSPTQYLAYAAALILFAFVPGLVMMREEPSEIV